MAQQPNSIVICCDNRDGWCDYRRSSLGASDASTICRVNPWSDILTLWEHKRGGADNEEPSEAMQMGIELEQWIRDKYGRETGRLVAYPGQWVIHRHPVYDWMHASLDALVYDNEKGSGVLECKNTSAYQASLWDEEAPVYYQIQLQHQLAVTGLKWGSIAVLIGGNQFRYVDVERDNRFIVRMIEAEKLFWGSVVSGDRPDPDGSPSSVRMLQKLHPDDNGESIELPPEAAEWDAELQAIKAMKKQNEEREAVLSAKIKAAIGPATYGVLRSGGSYSWKRSDTKGYSVEPKTARTLRRVK